MEQSGTGIPRPEHPRPDRMRTKWMNLNGTWEFEIDAGISGEARGLPAGGSFSRRITVPFCPESELSGIGEKDFMPCVWYRRAVTLPADWAGGRVLLHFGAVDYKATVWVNGKLAGSHVGGYSAFSFDITPHLAGGENVIVVRAIDDTRSDQQPTGKQSWEYDSFGCLYTRTTGIWQTVWLEAVPATFISTFRLTPAVAQKRLVINARIDGDPAGLTFRAEAKADGKTVGCVEIPADERMVAVMDLSELRLWQIGDPFLYDLELSLVKAGTATDKVQGYFGMRTISIQGKKVLLNGRSVFQRLVLDQGFYPDGIYTAPTDDALRGDIELSMAMGFNGARLHEKVFEPRFLYWADKLGYIVWGEYPNWGMAHNRATDLERVLCEWLEVLERDHNHPAIVGWCPFNETPQNQNDELLRTVYRATKQIDPTRPVIETSGWVHVETDIYDCHNYEQNPEKFAALFNDFLTGEKVYCTFPGRDAAYLGQPYFVSEYGGIWWNPEQKDDKAWGYGERPRTEEEFIARYKGLTEALLNHPRMFGFCYTQLTDVEQEVNGLYTYHRKPKFDPAIIRQINSQPAAIEKE